MFLTPTLIFPDKGRDKLTGRELPDALDEIFQEEQLPELSQPIAEDDVDSGLYHVVSFRFYWDQSSK